MKTDRWTTGKPLSQKLLQYLRDKNNSAHYKQNNVNTACSLPLSRLIFPYLFWFKALAFVGLEGICHNLWLPVQQTHKEKYLKNFFIFGTDF